MKTTTCCGKVKAVHYTCAVQFSKIIDNAYEMDQKMYEGDQNIELFCMDCNVNHFLRNNISHNHFDNVSVLICETR